MLGVASGLVAGLVAITPAAGFVGPLAAIVIGVAAGVICYLAVVAKARLGYDDALDAFGVHGVGGALGALLTGVFAAKAWGAPVDGAAFGGFSTLGVQALGLAAAIAYAVTMSFGILKLVDALVGLRVPSDAERDGLDGTLHGESGMEIGQMTAHPYEPAASQEGEQRTVEKVPATNIA
jgi:Amt family ammonium transporter